MNDNGAWDKGVPFRTERRVMGMLWSQCQWTGQCRWTAQKARNPPAFWVIQLVSTGLAYSLSPLLQPCLAVLSLRVPEQWAHRGWWGWAHLPGCVGLLGCGQLRKSQSLTLLQWGLAWIWGNKCSCISVQGFVPTDRLCSQLHDEMRSSFFASVYLLQFFDWQKLEAGSIHFFFSGIVLIS